MTHLLNNTVIKNLSPEMGKEIIQVYKDDGWDTRGLTGINNSTTGDIFCYYGVIDGSFRDATIHIVKDSQAKIITIEQAKQIINPMKQKQITLTVEQAKDILNDPDGIKALIRANFTEQELKGRVKSFEDLGKPEGFVVNNFGKVVRSSSVNTTHTWKIVYATEAQALAFGIAAPMLSQLMKEKNGDWVADWNDGGQMKYCIENFRMLPSTLMTNKTVQFLAFATNEHRDEFMEDHRDLITQYFAGF